MYPLRQAHDLPQAGEERFPCHKFILASGSAYFRQLLTGGEVSCHRLEGVQAPALRQLLLYLYTGTCDLLRPGPTDFRCGAAQSALRCWG